MVDVCNRFSLFSMKVQIYIFFFCFVEAIIIFVFLPHNFEANHNKDYSVVKTSKRGASNCSRFFYPSSK